ncbi:MAG: glycosyltransferase family A protein, partial [Candidatus Caenarcaniphilales bacterium]|nr:glycosyltransferase family A protein [Candidatus Caenarcaniphilales bacterium]
EEERSQRVAYLKRLERDLKSSSFPLQRAEPKISFLITNYNYAEFLPILINSIQSQNHKNNEIIIIDDCSTDNSREVIQEIHKNNPNMKIKVKFNDKNLGQLGAIASGYEMVEGEYLVLADADDSLDEFFVERHLYTHRFSSLCMLTSCDIRFVDRKGTLIHNNCYNSSGSWTKPLEYFAPFSFTLRDWVFAPCTANMFRKTKMLDLFFKVLDEETIRTFRYKGEWLLLYYANMLGGNTRLNECLVNFRLHSNNHDTHLHFPTNMVKALNSGDPNFSLSVEFFLRLFIHGYSEMQKHYSVLGCKTYIQWLYGQYPDTVSKFMSTHLHSLNGEIRGEIRQIYNSVISYFKNK